MRRGAADAQYSQETASRRTASSLQSVATYLRRIRLMHMTRVMGSIGLLIACSCLAGAVVIRASAATLGAHAPQTSDEATLKQLNQQYVDAFLKSDVQWYRQHVTEDFICIEPDGTLHDKASFLRDVATGPGAVVDYRLVEFRVRIIGDTAFIHAQGKATRKDGTIGLSRYTDVYIRVHGEWKTASAQITPILPARSAS